MAKAVRSFYGEDAHEPCLSHFNRHGFFTNSLLSRRGNDIAEAAQPYVKHGFMLNKKARTSRAYYKKIDFLVHYFKLFLYFKIVVEVNIFERRLTTRDQYVTILEKFAISVRFSTYI
jgi:hypothetical protein